MAYIEADDVRVATGIPSSLISDADLTEMIEYVESMTERWLNARFEPTEVIEVFDGNGSTLMFTDRNPLLSVRYLKSKDTEVELDTIYISKPSGKITLSTTSNLNRFTTEQQKLIVKYLHGWMEENRSASTSTTADATKGSSVTISVSDETSFAATDWVEIYGVDGNRETCQVTATAVGEITVDVINFDHVSGSKVVKLQIPTDIKRFMIYETAIAASVNAIGGTYTFNTSYSLGELQVTKGVPYPHFNTQFDKLQKMRDNMKTVLRPRPYVRM